MSGIPIPKPCFLDNCILIGAGYGRKRWKNKKGSQYYEWDSLHGEIEVYNKRGEHIGVFNHEGKLIKEAIKGRTINV